MLGQRKNEKQKTEDSDTLQTVGPAHVSFCFHLNPLLIAKIGVAQRENSEQLREKIGIVREGNLM